MESLYGFPRLLPQGAVGANMTQVDVYRTLPALYNAYFALKLQPRLAQLPGAQRNERESHTITETLDALIKGDNLQAVMVLLARLKAIEHATDATGGGWSHARHLEVAQASETGLITQQDRSNMMGDQRDHLRVLPGGRGQALAPGR